MGQLLERHYEEVSQARDEAALLKALVTWAGELDFGRVSAVVLRGDPGAPGFWGKSVGNPPDGYAEISTNQEFFKRDPLMHRLKAGGLPLAYDQDFYVAAGCGDLHEMIAPYGYRTGLALGMPTTGGQLYIGVDRETALPPAGPKRMRFMADLQLLAMHAQVGMGRLFRPPEAANEPLPRLTRRELQVLSLTAQGLTAKEAASAMGLSERGVHFHVQNALGKLGVGSKEAAVMKGVQLGLLQGGG